MMRLVFRVDGNREMGLGHLMRCRALAEALMAKGHDCTFVVAVSDPVILPSLRDAGISVSEIDAGADRDAQATLALVEQLAADGLVVDGYRFDADWRARLRTARRPILAFADGPLRPPDADLLIDAASPPSDDPTELFGPDYVLLRRELVEAARLPPLPIADRRSILVTFGGSDPAGLTVPTATSLRRVLPGVPLTVVVGAATADVDAVAARLSALAPPIDVHVAPARMGDLMRAAGLAISAAGGTVGELAAIGVPLVLAIVAENQVTGAAACAAAGWCTPIDARGDGDAPEKLARAARTLWTDSGERARRAALARQTVDPGGADRAAAAFIAMLPASSSRDPRPSEN